MVKDAGIKSPLLLLSLLIAAMLYAIINQLSMDQYLAVSGDTADTDTPVLIIDPGHGGEDGGAVSPDGLVESGLNLDIARRLYELCGFFGVRAVLSREGESLAYPAELDSTAKRKRWDTQQRTDFISSFDNAVLLSIHQNHFPDSRPRGPQAFYGKADGSRELAELIHGNLLRALYPESRRIAAPCPKEVYIMSHADCISVLVECAFLSNPEDCELLQQPEYRTGIAAILMASYLQYTEATNEGQNDILLHGVRQ